MYCDPSAGTGVAQDRFVCMRQRPGRAAPGFDRADGFSLVEVMVATGLLVTAVVTLAHVYTVATQANLASRHATYATILAAQKIEEFRASPPTDATRAEDRVGVYTRQWSIEPLPADPADSVVIQVLVTPGAGRLVTIQTRKAP